MDQSEPAKMRRRYEMKPSFIGAIPIFLRRNLGFWPGTATRFGHKHSNAAAARTSRVAPPVRCPMKWERTSAPVVSLDRGRKQWRLTLRYTPKKKATRRVLSPFYATQEEARAAANWWRLSWEQGKRGERTNPPEGHDEASRAPTLPQGKLPGQTCALMYTCTGTADIEALVTPRVHLSCVKKWASGANVHSCLRTAVRLLQQVFTLAACNAAVQVQVQVKGANFSLDPCLTKYISCVKAQLLNNRCCCCSFLQGTSTALFLHKRSHCCARRAGPAPDDMHVQLVNCCCTVGCSASISVPLLQVLLYVLQHEFTLVLVEMYVQSLVLWCVLHRERLYEYFG